MESPAPIASGNLGRTPVCCKIIESKERKHTCVHALCIQLSATLCPVARQAPLSLGFSRQQYWSGLPFPSPRDLPDPGFKPRSPALQVDSLPTAPPVKSGSIHTCLLLSPEQLVWLPRKASVSLCRVVSLGVPPADLGV